MFKPKLSDEKHVIFRHFATFYKVHKYQNIMFKWKKYKNYVYALSKTSGPWSDQDICQMASPNSKLCYKLLQKKNISRQVQVITKYFIIHGSCPLPEFNLSLNSFLFGHSTNHWTVGQSAVRPLDSWTEHCPTIGQLDTALSDYWTVGHSTDRSLDGWT